MNVNLVDKHFNDGVNMLFKFKRFNRLFMCGFCGVLLITLILSLHVGDFKKQDISKTKLTGSKVGSSRLYEKYKQALDNHDVMPEKREIIINGDTDRKFKYNTNDTEENYDFMLKLLKLNSPTTTTQSMKDKIVKINNEIKINEWKYKSQKMMQNRHQLMNKDDDNVVINCVTEMELYEYIPANTGALDLERFNNSYKESGKSRLHSFKYVFNSRAWGHSWDSNYKGLNASGRGATLDWAQETIATLHTTINKIKMALNKTEIRLLDIPCGDMAWMSRFLKTRDDISYTGIDIVPKIIEHHQKMFKTQSKWRFYNLDALASSTNIEQFDLIVCRTLLQHLYNYDVMELLIKFSESKSKFILLTTFPSLEENRELVIDIDNSGRFRRINLQLPPYSLSQPLCLNRDGPPDIQEGLEHFMGLWKLPLKQIPECEPAVIKPNGVPLKFYSCGVS